MRKVFYFITCILSSLFLTFLCSAQQTEEATLIVSGEGTTKDEAVNNALRCAIEQAYGVFVSSNSDILNDEIVKDEIATIASGNIKTYEEISSAILPNGFFSVSLSVVVSTGKLVSYVQSKGGSAEFAGQTFMKELSLQRLYKSNELIAMDHLLSELKLTCDSFYDCSLDVLDAKLATYYPYDDDSNNEARHAFDGVVIPIRITISENANFTAWLRRFIKTLRAISLDEAAVKNMEAKNIPVYWDTIFGERYYFRNKYYGEKATIKFWEFVASYLNSYLNRWVISIDGNKRLYPRVMNYSDRRRELFKDYSLYATSKLYYDECGYYIIDKKNKIYYSYYSYKNYYYPELVSSSYNGDLSYESRHFDLRNGDQEFNEIGLPVVLPFDLFFLDEEVQEIRRIEIDWQ